MDMGLSFSTHAYNTFASSALGYIAQLVPVKDEVLMAEQKGLNRMLPGPGNWRRQEDGF